MSLTDLFYDVKQSVRTLGRSPGLLAFAAGALALGIAAPTVMFTIANGVLRELPVPEGDRLVHVAARNARNSQNLNQLRTHELLAIREQQRTLTDVAAYAVEDFDLSAPGQRPERRRGARITTNLFRLLGVAPASGRDFTSDDGEPGAAGVVIISHALWQSQFAGASDVIGRSMRVEMEPATIVGVMPDGFRFPEEEELWVPLRLDPTAAPGTGRTVWGIGRLRPSSTLAQSETELAAIGRRVELAFAPTNQGTTFVVRPYSEEMLPEDIRRILATMVALVSFVLLIAAANVANLLLARAAGRTREIAIRATLGASRARLVGEQLLEALVIAIAGGAIGLALARVGIALFTRAIAADLPYWATFDLDLPVLLFAAGCIVVAAIASGLVPALKASGIDMHAALKDETRGTSSLKLGRTARALVAGQLALSCGLLVVAGLMIKGVLVMTLQRDYEPKRILTAHWDLRPFSYRDTASVLQFHRDLLERLTTTPGVKRAAIASHLPGVWTGWRRIELEGGSYTRDEDRPMIHAATISPGYFDTFGAPVARGRDFTWNDDRAAEPVVIVNEPFAEEYLPGQDPIGRRIKLMSGFGSPVSVWATIVGIVPHLGIKTEEGESDDALYIPIMQQPIRSANVVVDAEDPLGLIAVLRNTFAGMDRELPLTDVHRLDRLIALRRTVERVFGVLFATFGIVALTLAGIGLYALMSFSVSRRTRELGVRVALGATPSQVVWLALSGGLAQLGIGVLIGLAIAVVVAPSMGDALFGISPRDPLIFGAVPLLLSLCGIAAAFLPARRAVRLPVVDALRDN